MSKTHRSPSDQTYIKTTSKKKKPSDAQRNSDDKLSRYFDNKVKQLMKEKSKANSAK